MTSSDGILKSMQQILGAYTYGFFMQGKWQMSHVDVSIVMMLGEGEWTEDCFDKSQKWTSGTEGAEGVGNKL
jgi:hypothetical protein